MIQRSDSWNSQPFTVRSLQQHQQLGCPVLGLETEWRVLALETELKLQEQACFSIAVYKSSDKLKQTVFLTIRLMTVSL